MLQCEHSGGIRKRRENTNTHIHAHTLAALFPNLVDEEICCGTVATQADMEDYLRRVHSRLGAWEFDGPSIHVVLGGPEPDVDTIASTLCLALHLSQKDLSGGLCVPLLSGWRCDTVLPGETVRYLQKVKICESLLLWKDDVDLVKLHHNGKLSLMLLRDGLLDGSEYHTLESSILQVVHHDRQQDAGDDGASSTVTTVTREILQEAAEHIGAALGEALGEALRLQSEALWMKHGRRSVHLEELINSLEQRSDVTVGQHDEAKLQDLEDLMTKDLKEFSDGEMTIALTSVTMGEERGYMDQLKSFSDRHGYDGLVVVFSISDTVQLLCQRVAVYSNNTDILNQICSELEEYSNWSHGEQEFKECLSGCLQVYHLAMNTSSPSSTSSLLEKEIQGLLKEYVDQRSSVLACHPSSRTSSTEGVAGSVEFSQGSSGINSDIERAEGGNGDAGIESRVMENGEEDSGTVGVGAGGELVSPDSGMTTIRSSRSSKESSVFLSDESPIGEIIAGGGPAVGFLRNPSPLGFSCLPPPAPPERRKHRSSRNKSDNLDLFSFDPLHSSNHSMPAGGALTHTGERGDEGERKAGSSSLSEFEELNLVDFSAPSSVGDSINSSSHHQQYHGDVHAINVIDTVVPPTPVNSLVGSCPSSSCEVSFFPEDIAERISCLQHKDSVSSSLSEAWDELGFEMNQEWSSTDNMTKKSKNSWNIVERVQDKESSGKARESSEEILQSKNSSHKVMSLEPQLSLITEHSESYDNWNPNSVLKDQWNPVSLSDLQLTPPEEDVNEKCKPATIRVKEKIVLGSRKKALLNTLTPDTSKEEDDGLQGKKGERQMELLDFWTYSAQKGLLKSDSGTTTSYPESLDMWNMTIRDDSISPLTTPDNLSEHSDSFCGRIPKLEGGTSVESPPGFSDGGMEMWNTTIQEDSSSTVTSPEGPQTGSDLEHMGSWDATETHANKQVEEDKAIDNEEYTNKVLSQTPDKVGLIGEGNDHNVKIVIEGAEGRIQTEETGYDDIQNVQSPQSIMHNLASENLQDGTSPCEGPHIWDMPIPGMVTSTSEYDNVGADAWSLPSSPDAYANPVVDMVQLEGQSSPFIAVAKPVQLDKRHEQYQMSDFLGYGAVMADEKPANQVFTFDRPVELDHMTRSGRSSVESKYDNKSEQESEWIEPPRDHSPFVVITHHSCSGEAAVTKTLTDQSSTPSLVMWDNLPAISKKQDDLETASNNISSSHDLPIKMVCNEDRPGTESQVENNEGNGNVEGTITDTMFLSPSSGEEKETLKYSPDSFHPGSRDDLRSNSDGDSSSGLEMEYIIVSGTVKETERERKHQPKECDSVRQARGTGKSMETFSMLSFAATVLQSQVQAAHRQHQGSAEQTQQNEAIFIQTTFDSSQQSNNDMKHSSQSTKDTNTTKQASSKTGTSYICSSDQSALDTHSSSQPVTGSMHCQVCDNATQHHIVPEIISPNQSKSTEVFHPSDLRPTSCSSLLAEEGNYDNKSSITVRSVSSSLRYPSDHFLKTKEEVYVHSQISVEDSDEGGQSPCAVPPCLPSLGDLQVWGDQLVRQDIPQTTSDPQTPALTNSSVSHTSSLIGTPVSESGLSTEKGLGLPFSGDLMEEEDDEEEHDEEISAEHSGQSRWISEVRCEKEETDPIQRSQIGSSVKPKKDRFPQNLVGYSDGQPVRTVGFQEWLTEQQIGSHGVSQERESPIAGCQDVTSQLSFQLPSDDAVHQWTGYQNVTQSQTQYGYNYHHIDQRTENQTIHQGCIHTKSSSQQNTTDVYAEFTTVATQLMPASEPAGNDNEAGDHVEYSLDDPGARFQYLAKGQYAGDSSSLCASELKCSQYQADDQSHYNTDSHYQFDGKNFNQSDTYPDSERQDHAQYVPEGYVHFLLSREAQLQLKCRSSQQEDSAARMMMKTTSSEEAAEEIDNREDPPSSLDLSGGSTQRRKLAAPPMNVSLDHSEGSLLSDDALDTEDEALDTGDDLDVNLDELDTPDEADSLDFNTHGDSEEYNLDAGAATSDVVPGHSAGEESRDSRLWRSVVIGEQEHRIDMKCIESYKRVISHGGYYAEHNAIIVFAACFLPDSDCDNYNYVMENLFLYVISTLELMVAENYMIVYLNGATPRRRMPGFTWMKKCYQMIDRRLKKNLKMFIIAHPSWFIRTLLGITRPFISSKFSSKIKYVNSLEELREIIPMEYVHIPSSIIKLDKELQDTTQRC